MESLQKSISEMMVMFQNRMSVFEEELQKTPTAPSTTVVSLASEFAAFRGFIIQALNNLQCQVEVLARSMDNLEMQGRRKILLLHGVAEVANEDTNSLLVDIMRDKLQVKEITVADIRRSHRMGRSISNKPRPILVKLASAAVRDKVWFAKKILKGSGITMSEFLTKARHDVFLAARDKYGVAKCWTKAGSVYVVGSDGTRHRVATFADLERIGSGSCLVGPEATESNSVEPDPIAPITPVKATSTKSRRAAAQKK